MNYHFDEIIDDCARESLIAAQKGIRELINKTVKEEALKSFLQTKEQVKSYRKPETGSVKTAR